MFKKLLKSRHDRKAEVSPPAGHNAGNNQGNRLSAYSPDEYPYQVSPNISEGAQTPGSCVPVDYNMSPPTPFGSGGGVSSPMPHGGVEYTQSPPIVGYSDQSPMAQGVVEYTQSPPIPQPPPQQEEVSMAAIDYSQSEPAFQSSSDQRNVSMAAVEYSESAPSQPAEDVNRNTSMGPAVEYRASAPNKPFQNNQIRYNEPLHVYAVELPANTPRIHSPQELSGSPAPQRYELPTPSTNRSIPSTPSTVSTSPRTPNSTWTNGSLQSTPGTTPATSPPPPYSNQMPRFAPPAAAAPKQSSPQEQVIKFTVNIFCQKKTLESNTGREELPRDVREFRLAKVALIPVSAGERRFVSLDVVFGEVDKAAAGFLEKHYLITPDSKLEKYTSYGISSNAKVWKIQPLKVAYKGFSSLVYLTFRSVEDEKKFQADFEKVKRLSEHC